jgi:hypothetical protein
MQELAPSAPKHETQAAGPAKHVVAQAATAAAHATFLKTLQPEGVTPTAKVAVLAPRAMDGLWNGSLMALSSS